MTSTHPALRSRLRRQAIAALFLFSLVILGVWIAYRFIGAALGDNRPPEWPDLLLVAALVLGTSLWNATRRSRETTRSWVRVVSLWRQRSWSSLFGFSCAVGVFGVVLGLLCSTGKWLTQPPATAMQFALIYALIGAALGFVGGFSTFLPGADGMLPALRRKP